MLMRYKILLIILIFTSCESQNSKTIDKSELKNVINKIVDNWHKAATETNDSIFFNSMAENSIYIGTDKNELWTKKEFYNFAINYFERGKAWDFKPIERNIYFSNNNEIIWFDEKLDTWMGVCRASGVMKQIEKEWKIVHYHLSMTIPNEKVKDIIEIIGKE